MRQKRNIQLTMLSLLVLVLVVLTFLMARYINPTRITIKTSTLTHSQIDASFDGFKILYFSDLQYNEFVDQKRLSELVEKINEAKPDVILFGGDLLAKPFINNEDEAFFINQLKSLKAPYGKFAVMGDLEVEQPNLIPNLSAFYLSAHFELLNNTSTKLYYQNDAFINLVGLDNSSSIEVPQMEGYTFAFGHSPTLADQYQANIMVVGQTHGGQIDVPWLRNLFIKDSPYTKARQQVDAMRLDISNGVGTSIYDVRLLAPAQLNLYILKSE